MSKAYFLQNDDEPAMRWMFTQPRMPKDSHRRRGRGKGERPNRQLFLIALLTPGTSRQRSRICHPFHQYGIFGAKFFVAG
jgi:hypothetical protein